jgi:hypothetical protein
VDYPDAVSTKTADLTTIKCHWNSTLSDEDAQYLTLDLKDFYLGTPMECYEYFRIHRKTIPPSIWSLYNLDTLIQDDYVYVEVRKGMYGLPQAGRLANDRLTTFLAHHGYRPTALTPGLWRHDTRDISFTLVVDDFGIKYKTKHDAQHLIDTLQLQYKVSVDWTGKRYCGIDLTWDYLNRTLDIAMPDYVTRALQRFNHAKPSRQQHSPHRWIAPQYGSKIQYPDEPDTSPPLGIAEHRRVQQVLGTLLYYSRAVDLTMLTAISTLATQQAQPTAQTMTDLVTLLNYAATHPNAVVRFQQSDMILHVESDASYLSAGKARSRAGGFHYLGNQPGGKTRYNGPVNVLCQIMHEVQSSAAEAELGALFLNAKEACPTRICLEELGHSQPATPIVTDNSTATGISNDSVKQKRSKAIDMRYYWVRDRVRQNQFRIHWKPGKTNRADYFTKHHPASHHQAIRSAYLHEPSPTPTRNYFEALADDTTTTTISQNK